MHAAAIRSAPAARRQAVAGRRSRTRDAPAQQALRASRVRRQQRAAVDAGVAQHRPRAVDVSAARDPVNQPWPACAAGAAAPASSRPNQRAPRRRRRLRIDRDDLEVGLRRTPPWRSRTAGCACPSAHACRRARARRRAWPRTSATPSSSVRAATTRWSSCEWLDGSERHLAARCTAARRRRRSTLSSPSARRSTRPARPQRRALGRDIARGREAAADQPLRQAGVQAAGDRVFVARLSPDEGAHLELRVVPVAACGADDAELRGRPAAASPAAAPAPASADASITAHPARTVVAPTGARRRRARAMPQRRGDARQQVVAPAARCARSGGAANASRVPSRRTRTRPTPHCCTTSPAARGRPPAASQAWQLPSVGWPANGSSRAGREDAHAVVGVRRRSAAAGRSSRDRLVQRAKAAICASSSPSASMHHGQRVAVQRVGR